MKRFKNIILVFDPKTTTKTTIVRAESLAKSNAARLMIFAVTREIPQGISKSFTIVSPKELHDLVVKDYQQKMDVLVSAMVKKGIKAKAKVVSGTPFLEIIRQVLRAKHDLVIIAAEGKGRLTERLFGSTSMHLMRKCPCPVWVVKSSKSKRYMRVLAAIDTTDVFPDPEQESLNPLILQLASSMANIDESELHVVQAWSVYAEGYMSVRGGISDDAINEMRRFARRQYSSQVDNLLADTRLGSITVYKHLPRSEDVSNAIVSLAKSKKVDLLVMGTVCRTGVAGLIIGNTAEKVLNKVDCSVLTVKPEGFVTPVTLEDR